MTTIQCRTKDAPRNLRDMWIQRLLLHPACHAMQQHLLPVFRTYSSQRKTPCLDQCRAHPCCASLLHITKQFYAQLCKLHCCKVRSTQDTQLLSGSATQWQCHCHCRTGTNGDIPTYHFIIRTSVTSHPEH